MPVKILLAEDNLINQKVAVRMLEKIGHRIDVVSNGREVVDLLKRVGYEIILMDVMMPEMDGLETTRHIRSKFPEKQQPYIIALTANAMTEDREKCLDAGMDDYLSKPIKRDMLKEVIDRAVFEVSTTEVDEPLWPEKGN